LFGEKLWADDRNAGVGWWRREGNAEMGKECEFGVFGF
jgi:hypothetical protein